MKITVVKSGVSIPRLVTHGKRITKFSLFISPRATFSSFVSNAEGCLQNPNTPFKKQHSNSFIDLNGDCAADLFLQSTDGENNYFEIWMKNTRDGKFCLVEKSVVNTKITPLAFYDIGIENCEHP